MLCKVINFLELMFGSRIFESVGLLQASSLGGRPRLDVCFVCLQVLFPIHCPGNTARACSAHLF